MAGWVHFLVCLRLEAIRPGGHLTTLFGHTAVPTIAALGPQPEPKKKRGWLPLLTVLFLFSYGLMTMLIMEQGVTIESQRYLIRELFRDSSELSGIKMKAQVAANAAAMAKAQGAKNQAQTNHTPSTQTPSTQAPSIQTPSSQAAPQHGAQNQSARKPFQMPSRPPMDLGDDRRALHTI